jgi:hypothetical protein
MSPVSSARAARHSSHSTQLQISPVVASESPAEMNPAARLRELVEASPMLSRKPKLSGHFAGGASTVTNTGSPQKVCFITKLIDT